MKMQENIPLQDFTAFRTGGRARYFSRVKSIAELRKAVRFAKEKKLPFFVLGRGANLLIPDAGFSGLVIKMEMKGIRFKNTAFVRRTANSGAARKKNDTAVAIARAGEDWDSFVAKTVWRKCAGLENLSLIPSTVGAAAIGNIGAYGAEAKDIIFSVQALNTETMKIKKFSNKECNFGYRESFFKTNVGKKYIVTQVSFILKKKGKARTEYKDVQEYFSQQKIIAPSLKNVRDAIIAIRTKKLPDISKVGTAGSFFKNPIVSKRKADALKKEYPDLPIFALEEKRAKLSAGFLLDKICGLKGYKKGNIGLWNKQALVLVNYGGGTTKEILLFAGDVKKSVKEKTGIKLEMEVQVI
ncbi:MAG: UDP-N-acetylmuramate dehydrogenase [Candidatus Paceibacterota bacterium]